MGCTSLSVSSSEHFHNAPQLIQVKLEDVIQWVLLTFRVVASLFNSSVPLAVMSASHDDAHITANLKRKREDFLHGLGITDQLLLSYEELLSNAGVCQPPDLSFCRKIALYR